jgi:exonuclease SbcD
MENERIKTLLSKSSYRNLGYILANFSLGEALGDVSETEMNEAAAAFNVPVSFLYDARRVFKSFKHKDNISALYKELGGKVSWGWLAGRCTKAPEGDSEEAVQYWINKLFRIGNATQEFDKITELLKELPETVRVQVEGLLRTVAMSQPSMELTNGPREVLGGAYKFGHIADMQLDDNFTVAGRLVIDPVSGKNERLLDIHKCLSFAVDKMIAAGCRACFVAGDATETATPSPNVQGFLQYSMMRLAELMPVIMITGNHELSREPKDASALEFLKGRKNIHVVEKPTILYQEGLVISEKPSGIWPQKDCAKIFCLPFPSRAIAGEGAEIKSMEELNMVVSDALRMQLDIFRSELDPAVPNILVGHIAVGGAEGAENNQMLKYDPWLYPEDFRGFDYVGLGHLHKHQPFYCGSIDRMNFDEESDPKGFNLVTMDGRTPVTEFIKTPAREFKTLSPEFFAQPDWIGLVETRTIYRIKGEVTKEEYEALKEHLKAFPVPILNKLTVKRDIRVRDEKMTEDINEGEALQRHLASKGEDAEFIADCLKKHAALIKGEPKKEEVNTDGPTLFAAA